MKALAAVVALLSCTSCVREVAPDGVVTTAPDVVLAYDAARVLLEAYAMTHPPTIPIHRAK